MGYAANTPSLLPTRLPEVVRPSNTKGSSNKPSDGKAPTSCFSLSQLNSGVPPRRGGSTKSLPKIFPRGVTLLSYPHPSVRPLALSPPQLHCCFATLRPIGTVSSFSSSTSSQDSHRSLTLYRLGRRHFLLDVGGYLEEACHLRPAAQASSLSESENSA